MSAEPFFMDVEPIGRADWPNAGRQPWRALKRRLVLLIT
jgi:hypothetical protein